MRVKRFLGIMLAYAFVIGCFCTNVGAVESAAQETGASIARASGKFTTNIPSNETFKASSSFPLEAGETVTINASYSPFSSSVDFGLLASDGRFIYVTVTSGSVNQKITVSQRGNYTFAIKNNSSVPISVSGNVNY